MASLDTPDLPLFYDKQAKSEPTYDNDQIQVGVIIESTEFRTDANEVASAMEKAKFVSIQMIKQDDVIQKECDTEKQKKCQKQRTFEKLRTNINTRIIKSHGFHKRKETVLFVYVSAHISKKLSLFYLNKIQKISMEFDELKRLVVYLNMNINIIIVDGCHAGSFTSEGFKYLPIYIIGSCRVFEKSKGGDDGLSPFTCYFLEYFEKNTTKLYMEKLARYVKHRYSEMKYIEKVTISAMNWDMPAIRCWQTNEDLELPPEDPYERKDTKKKKIKEKPKQMD